MRIIAGRWRGRPLLVPAGRVTRPTSDRAREGLFSMLASRLGTLEGLRAADLFAGSGALGLEALSRGAAHCLFVEQDRAALNALRANIAALGADATVRAGAAEGVVLAGVDLLLLDPPYGSGAGHRVLAGFDAAPSVWASLETARVEAVAVEGWAVEAERTYSKAKITLLRRT